MRYIPWRFLLVCAVLAALLAFGYPYLLSAGAWTLMAAHGQASGCDWRANLGSFKSSSAAVAAATQAESQVRSVQRDGQGFELIETPLGRFWAPDGQTKALTVDAGEQLRDIYGEKGLGVRRGDIVLDVGANVGLYTRVALAAGAAKVVAIEPVPANIACLRRNFPTEIAAGRVLVVEKGAWNKPDWLDLRVGPDNLAGGSFVLQPGGETRTLRLPLTTLDQMAADAQLPRVDFIKMDIEGAEREAVAGAAAILRRDKPRLALCVYHLPDDPTVLPQLVRGIRPDYALTCGSCYFAVTRIRPQVFFFH